MMPLPSIKSADVTLCHEDAEFEGRVLILRWGRFALELAVAIKPGPAHRCAFCRAEVDRPNVFCSDACAFDWATK